MINTQFDENEPDHLMPIIDEGKTKYYCVGWLFYWNSKSAILNGKSEDGYIGNAPIFVDKFDGTTFYINTIFGSIKEKIKKYCVEKGYRYNDYFEEE